MALLCLQSLRLAIQRRPWDGGASDGGAIPISTCGEGDEPADPPGKGRIAEGFALHHRTPWTSGPNPGGCRTEILGAECLRKSGRGSPRSRSRTAPSSLRGRPWNSPPLAAGPVLNRPAPAPSGDGPPGAGACASREETGRRNPSRRPGRARRRHFHPSRNSTKICQSADDILHGGSACRQEHHAEVPPLRGSCCFMPPSPSALREHEPCKES